LQGSQYPIEHTAGVGKHIVVPKADDLPPLALQPVGSGRILGIGGMLTAAEFDRQPVFDADEIDDIAADRVLPPKPVPA
jgi:hypothetical protein